MNTQHEPWKPYEGDNLVNSMQMRAVGRRKERLDLDRKIERVAIWALVIATLLVIFAVAANSAPVINTKESRLKETDTIAVYISVVPTSVMYNSTATATATVVVTSTSGSVTNPAGTRIRWALDSALSVPGADVTFGSIAALATTISGFSVPGIYALKPAVRVNRFAPRIVTITLFSVTSNENIAPEVSITSPATGATYIAGDNVAIEANATDADGTIATVRFYYDATFISEDTTGPPYTATYSGITAGTHSLNAIAIDNLGTATSSASVTISATTPQAPSITFLTPTNGLKVVGPIPLTLLVSASDPQGQLVGVHFLSNGVPVGVDTTAPFEHAMSSLPIKTYLFQATASNLFGLTRTVGAKVSIIPAVNIAPVVAVTAPTNSAVFTTGNNVVVSADATDADGTIASVVFYDGVTPFGTNLALPYTNVLSAIAVGSHTISAVATDNLGSEVSSLPILITVSTPPQPPSLTILSPIDGLSATAPVTVFYTVSASDPQNALVNVKFFRNATLIATLTAPPFTIGLTNHAVGAWTFTALATNIFNLGRAASVSYSINPPANIAPTTSITSPATGAQYTNGNSVVVSAIAADADGTVAQVRFFLDGVLFATDTNAPYAGTISSISAGTHTLTTLAIDNLGAQTLSAGVIITAVVPPPGPDPIIVITAPTNGASFLTPISVMLSAVVTNTVPLAGVKFYTNGVEIAAFGPGGPYTFTMTNTQPGTYLFLAMATNNIAQGATDARSFTVTQPVATNIPPSVALTSPADGAVFHTGDTIPLAATASDVDGFVVQVAFWRDATSVGSDTVAPYTGSIANQGYGHFTILARSVDNLGAQSTTATATITVQPDLVLSWTSAALGAAFDYVTGWQVWRSTGGAFSQIATTTVASITNANLSAGVTYSYYVKSVNILGAGAQSSTFSISIP